MIDLVQRIKDLDPAKFEELCFQILSEKFPGAGLKHVEGKAGDRGTDLFAGVLEGRPAIWQCKFFRDGIKDVQKRQIKKSLKRAITEFSPHSWTLCVPVNLTINAHSWFQKLAQQHGNVKIDSFDASMIAKELIFRKPITELFFPDAVLNVAEIKAMLRGTGKYSDSDLASLADENVDQYIERLRQKEPRYDYQLSYHSGNAGISAFEGGPQMLPPNTIMSVWQGNRRLDLVPRDVEAVRKDPPHFTVTVNAEGAHKIQNALRTRSSLRLEEGELLGFKSSFDFLMPPEQLQRPFGLVLTLRNPKVHESFRVTFENTGRKVIYDLIEFDIAAKEFGDDGRHHAVEFTSTSSHVPFDVSMKFSLDDLTASFTLETKFRGRDILEVEKCLDGLAALKDSGGIELFDLRRGQSLGAVKAELNTFCSDGWKFEQIARDLAEVARAFSVQFTAPDVISKTDLDTMALLLEVCRNGEILGGTVNDLTAKLVRRDEPLESILGPISGEFMIGLENDTYPPQQLLGKQVIVGPCRIVIERASLCDLEETRKTYTALNPGESMPVRFVASGPVRQIFPRFYKEPLAPLVPV